MDDFFDTLAPAVLDLLRAAPEGMSEHVLLKALQARLPGALPAELLDPLQLFRAHFLLFHVLYRLRDALRAQGRAELVIDPLGIRLLPYAPGREALAADDALRAYYLDPGHLQTTTGEEVAVLLARFHARLKGGASRARALAELGLADPVSDAQIKRRYRRLAQRHHPDRGGDAQRLQAINAALRILLP